MVSRRPTQRSLAAVRHLPFTIPRGADLDEALLRELWSFRGSILRYKPETSLDDDFARFSARCRRSDRVLVVRHPDGRPGGMLAVVRRRIDGGRTMGFFPEYLIVSPELRASRLLGVAYVRLLAALLEPYDLLASWFMIGIAYPASFLATSRLARVWIDGEPGIPVHAQQRIDALAEELAGTRRDPVARRVTMPTIPGPLRERLLEAPEYQRYVARNPEWRRGFGVMIYAEGTAASVGASLLRSLRRRALRGASSAA